MARRHVILRDQGGAEYRVETGPAGSVITNGRTMNVFSARPHEVRVDDRTVWVASIDDERWVFVDGQVYILELETAAAASRETTTAAGPRSKSKSHREGTLTAPMPATVVKVGVAPGDRVKAGDVLIILEAMKMELPVRVAMDATVKAIRCRPGELVQPGEQLVELEPVVSS